MKVISRSSPVNLPEMREGVRPHEGGDRPNDSHSLGGNDAAAGCCSSCARPWGSGVGWAHKPLGG
eukprot:1056513-Prymnesium_polylepis.1